MINIMAELGQFGDKRFGNIMSLTIQEQASYGTINIIIVYIIRLECIIVRHIMICYFISYSITTKCTAMICNVSDMTCNAYYIIA